MNSDELFFLLSNMLTIFSVGVFIGLPYWIVGRFSEAANEKFERRLYRFLFLMMRLQLGVFHKVEDPLKIDDPNMRRIQKEKIGRRIKSISKRCYIPILIVCPTQIIIFTVMGSGVHSDLTSVLMIGFFVGICFFVLLFPLLLNLYLLALSRMESEQAPVKKWYQAIWAYRYYG